MNFQRTTRNLVRLIAITGVAFATAVSAAQGEPDDPFTPRLEVSASTTQAGAHPDLTIAMRKDLRNHCTSYENPNQPPGLGNKCTDLYYEQNVKQMTVHLPVGLVPDANAATYCDAFQKPEPLFGLQDIWDCRNEEAFIGVISITNQLCDRILAAPTRCLTMGAPLPDYPYPDDGYQYFYRGPGLVYMEESRTSGPFAGEAGHMVVLWPKVGINDETSTSSSRSDISVMVRESDVGIDSVATGIPDSTPGIFGSFVGQPVDIELTLKGERGLAKGHPLLTNPTFCDPQFVDTTFGGWANNSRASAPFNPSWLPGSGDGKEVKASVPYQATNCDAVPYAPTFTASTDSEAPGAAAALSTVITQKDDEATTKKVHVEFPKGMGVNINSTLTPCSAADLAAKSCPEVSKMGTVIAESRLLPKREILGDSVKPEDEVLTGSVFLTGLEGNKLTLSALLSGFIDLRLDAKAGVDANGMLTATFDDLPSLPYNKFTLSLFGGNRGLLTNPRPCGTHTTKATFTSHSGKTHTVEAASQVKGCSAPPEPEFEVDLSENTKGKRTAVEFNLSARDRYIKKVTFGLPRYLKFSTKRLGKKKKFGSMVIETERGELESSLSLSQSVRAKRKKKKAIRFSTKGGLNKLKVSLFKRKVGTKKVKIRTKSGKKKTLKRSVLKSRMSFKSLPKQDIKDLRVELNPSESRFLRNPKGCKKPLRFLAFVTTSDGKRHVLSQKVRLKGKGCSKKKKSKKNK